MSKWSAFYAGLFATKFDIYGAHGTVRAMIPTRIHLAPMEGLMDAPLRTLVTAVGGYDLCTSEFVRVTPQRLPDRVFHRFGPELSHASATPSGTPFRIQLLGSDPEYMALNALTAVRLGSPSIDLNFGCPAKTVNKSQGGSILLKQTDLIHRITRTVRDALPAHIELTVKMRLGYDDPSVCIDNALAFEDAGASELVVHARTKTDAYRPPAHWHYLRDIREALAIPVVANGEVWSRDDWRRCYESSGCDQLMIGRGAVARPDLAMQLKDPNFTPWTWADYLDALNRYWELLSDMLARQACNDAYRIIRIKQWLNQSQRGFDQGPVLFNAVKRLRTADEVYAAISAAQRLTR